jgi:hypothetical protein
MIDARPFLSGFRWFEAINCPSITEKRVRSTISMPKKLSRIDASEKFASLEICI